MKTATKKRVTAARKPAKRTAKTLGATKSKPIDYKLVASLGLKAVKLRDVKPKDIFTLTPIEYPKENQVWIKEANGYDRASKTFACYNWSDISRERFFKPDRIVYQEFYF